MAKRSLDVDVDEKGYPVLRDEPKVSAKTGKRRKGNPKFPPKKTIERALELVRNGSYVKQAIISAGYSYNNHLRWIKLGKKEIKPYDEYYEAFEKAKAESETDIVNMLHDSIASGNVGTAQWMLSRKFPKRWEKTERQEVKVDNTQKIEIVRYSDKHGDDEEDSVE